MVSILGHFGVGQSVTSVIQLPSLSSSHVLPHRPVHIALWLLFLPSVHHGTDHTHGGLLCMWAPVPSVLLCPGPFM